MVNVGKYTSPMDPIGHLFGDNGFCSSFLLLFCASREAMELMPYVQTRNLGVFYVVKQAVTGEC